MQNKIAYLLTLNFFCAGLISLNAQTATDIEGNVYKTVTIGTQTWMADNLKTTKYNNGTPIPIESKRNIHFTSAYCWYKNDSTNKDTYGALYNWYTVNTGRLCPTDWHIPNDADWAILISDLGGETVAGGKLKESGTSSWNDPNDGATNESGFTARPGGYSNPRYKFFDIGNYGYWWSSTKGSTYNTGFRDITFNYRNLKGVLGYKLYDFSVRCVRNKVPALPILTTRNVTDINSNTATSGGIITYDEGKPVTSRGVCWSTSHNPVTTDSHTTDSSGIGKYTSSITGLEAGTVYHLRAYAANSSETIYGNELIFTTKTEAESSYGNEIFDAYNGEIGSLSDIDGNTYQTKVIGTQIWMTENLKTTRYSNGDPIGTTTPSTLDISIDRTPRYQWAYDGKENNLGIYGRLYSWYAVADSRNICPKGWHVPNNAEWIKLTDCFEDKSVAGGKFKSITGWKEPNKGATDNTGFTGLPGGGRNENGTFHDIGSFGYWWSSTGFNSDSAWYRYLCHNNNTFTWEFQTKQDGLSVRCLSDFEKAIAVPTVFTSVVSTITAISAICGGRVTGCGGATVTSRGVCWSISPKPTILDNLRTNGKGSGTFTSSITGLKAGTLYYVRAYASNSAGISYGKDFSFISAPSGATLNDSEGNVYNTIILGTQTWMAENLKTTKYNDGPSIPLVTDTVSWSNLSTPGYCWYNNDDSVKKAEYGSLYNWYSVNTGKLCPAGWHVPNDTEWKTLEMYFGMPYEVADIEGRRGTDQGTQLKNTKAWKSGGNGTNTSGFAGLPGGYRNRDGQFNSIGDNGNFWSSTESNSSHAWGRSLNYSDGYVNKGHADKRNGFSVRCIKD